MTMWLAALGSLATIVGAVYGIFKWIAWKTRETPQESKQKIDEGVQKSEDDFANTGRP